MSVKQKYVVLSQETWNIIESLLMELPFKISSQVVQKIREDTGIMVISDKQYEVLKQQQTPSSDTYTGI